MRPPRWLVRIAWVLHRIVFAASGGRVGAVAARADRLGTLFLTTTGHRSGRPRRTGLYYLADGPDLVVVASNAGAADDPVWWRNLQAAPDALVELGRERRPVRARAATADEHGRLWPRLVAVSAAFADYQRTAGRPIPVVILEPR